MFGYSELVCLCLLQASGEAQYTTDIPVLPEAQYTTDIPVLPGLTNMVYTSYSSHRTAIHTDAAMVITTHLLSTPFYFLLLLQTAAFALTNMVYTSYSSHSLLTYHSLMQSNAKITAIHTDAAMVITTHLHSVQNPLYSP